MSSFKKIFVILAEPRTGTSLVSEKFCTFQPIRNLNEFFVDRVDLQTLRKMFDHGRTSILIKILSVHINFEELEELLSWPEVEVIYIRRLDKLATYVSWMKALEYNLWDSVDTSNVSIEIDIEDYSAYYKKSIDWHESISELIKNKKVLSFVYEHDLEDFNFDKFFLKVSNWLDELGVKLLRRKFVSNFGIKQNKSSLEKSITNFDIVLAKCNRY